MQTQEIIALISKLNAKLAILLCHHNADPDALGAAFAFKGLLKHLRPNLKTEIAAASGISKLSKYISNFLPIEKSEFPELCERKGTGHPDTVCDAVADACSRALCMYYLENFDRVYHHNVDKAALVGGTARPEFGGGQIIQPQYFLIVGRAINQILTECGDGSNKLEYIPITQRLHL